MHHGGVAYPRLGRWVVSDLGVEVGWPRALGFWPVAPAPEIRGATSATGEPTGEVLVITNSPPEDLIFCVCVYIFFNYNRRQTPVPCFNAHTLNPIKPYHRTLTGPVERNV